MEGYMTIRRIQKLWQARVTRIVVLVLAVACVVVTFQSSTGTFGGGGSGIQPPSVFEFSHRHSGNAAGSPPVPGGSLAGGSINRTESRVGEERGEEEEDDDDYEEDGTQDEFLFDIGDGTVLRKAKDGHIVVEKVAADRRRKDTPGSGDPNAVPEKYLNRSGFLRPEQSETRGIENNITRASPVSSSPAPPTAQSSPPPPPLVKKKKKDKFMGVWSVADMDRELLRNRANPETMIPQWPSHLDQQLVDAKRQIENAPIITSDPELYPPVFRNFSMFKRSYELMEQILKVYVYKEGERPIFHTPFFTGIYASEGWFMKHMQENTQFVVNDPGRAHLFYLPFSSRTLQAMLYIANSHSHDRLIQHLKEYVKTIAAKYPFWNRTGGADHFLAGCHDWATHETGRSMPTTIRALCNADVREGFELGKDISLPETNVRYRDDPLRGLGGKPARKRTTLAFFAGSMHGYLRPILLQHWENKDPSMKIFGMMPHYGATTIRTKKNKRKKVNIYVDYMKDSKYCICPRGYEVNSPRVMEAIFYECVPVIISDNFVPPLFEVLNWDAFSVILPEKDVPRLKEVLEGIPQKRYLRLLFGVKKVQRHFLWNKTPVRFDLFHMVLHSVWFNRVFQFRTG